MLIYGITTEKNILIQVVHSHIKTQEKEKFWYIYTTESYSAMKRNELHVGGKMDESQNNYAE